MARIVINSGDCTPTVKNTFLTFKLPCEETEETSPRSNSVPPSSRLNKESSIVDGKFTVAHLDSDVSTQDGSSCSESGNKSPDHFDDFHTWSKSLVCGLPSGGRPAPLHQATPSEVHQRLSSKASLFMPSAAEEKVQPQLHQYKQNFLDVITYVKNALLESPNISNIEVNEDAGTYSIILQPTSGQGNRDQVTDCLLTLAKEVLLEATGNSRCIYLMGYCSAKPFVMQPQGFEATLAAMESPVTACWHVFKKGFCRHGNNCAKIHPVVEFPVRILVESVQFNASSRFVSNFKQEVADLTMAVIASLGECNYTEKVEAFKDKDCQGWTIEVTLKQSSSMHKNYILTLAKSALFSATNNSNTVYIMGYAQKPFQPKKRGFVTLLGDMQDESVACWDFYSKGMCRHDCSCRWVHPECLVPINVALKEHTLCLQRD